MGASDDVMLGVGVLRVTSRVGPDVEHDWSLGRSFASEKVVTGRTRLSSLS
jgi:hypothetical protein